MVNFLRTGVLIALDKTEWHSGNTLTYVWEVPALILSPDTSYPLLRIFIVFHSASSKFQDSTPIRPQPCMNLSKLIKHSTIGRYIYIYIYIYIILFYIEFYVEYFNMDCGEV